ncbi:MAG: acetate--CoA ligase [Chloroflexi bacterium]|nr:acetate--CoA ligase [Chloroflexota bacterium]NJD66435.1 acetate--CoA ligase [Chloroflexota bacterium]PWB43302.1 MAG: acetate--CoA ligase [Dehalococcoidia bacterium]
MAEVGLPVDERYAPPARVSEGALVSSMAEYEALYRRSIDDRDAFWSEMANKHLTWMAPFTSVCQENLHTGEIRWFDGGKLNVSVNCLDRHLAAQGDKTAIIMEGDEPGTNRSLTYRKLHAEVCRLANALRKRGVKKGDRVAIYMGMVPELAAAMLACARIGAVHSVIFGGFSPRSIRDRIDDSTCKAIITQDEGRRGGRLVPLKANVDEALKAPGHTIEFTIVFRHTGNPVNMQAGRDLWWHDTLAGEPAEAEPEVMDSEDPLFVLYTSGSTGKPKGVLHTQAGYLLYTALSHRYVFDIRDEDVYCCAADVGWITGHSYIVYGPLANGTTSVMFESVPTYPDAGRYWDMVDRLGITVFYTAPTAIRAIAREGNDQPRRYSRKSLRVLGTVGEPINPEAWRWYYNVVGEQRCAIVDTYWQTETGGHMITGFAGATVMKPGSGSLPFFGVQPCVVDEVGEELLGNNVTGRLCMKASWPGMMRTVYGDHERFVQTYLSLYPGKYFTGDGCLRDQDGYYWITGRVDDVLNVAGHRLGTAEIEGALVGHPACAEAAVVGYPHDVKGTAVYAYVHLNAGYSGSAELAKELRDAVRRDISAIATPDKIQFVEGLPKTRSGKIMRRILRKIAEGEPENVGDVTTLADPAVVEDIIVGAAKAE